VIPRAAPLVPRSGRIGSFPPPPACIPVSLPDGPPSTVAGVRPVKLQKCVPPAISEICDLTHPDFSLLRLLGNCSLGDYYNRFHSLSYEFLTPIPLAIPPADLLWVLVFEAQVRLPDEAAGVGVARQFGIPEDRIIFFRRPRILGGAGPEGPCGDRIPRFFRSHREPCKKGAELCMPGHCVAGGSVRSGNNVFMSYEPGQPGHRTAAHNVDNRHGSWSAPWRS